MPESTMLRFIQMLPQAPPEGDFLLKDLPGSGKRIDILCRDLAACFDWAPVSWSKSQLEIIAVIGNKKTLTFREPKEQIPRGEVGWASIIRESLRGTPPSYVEVADETLDDVVQKLVQSKKSKVWVLDEEGVLLSEFPKIDANTQNSFMLGDHRGFDSETESIMSQYDIPRLSLGKKSYLSSHCLASLISEFERVAHK
jgi:tRNA (pseudouridine54-N1)-methyltransferase